MPFVEPTDRPIYWAVNSSGAVIAAGLTAIGDFTATGEDKLLPNDVDENTFLGKVIELDTIYNPLPDVGERVEGGIIYSTDSGLAICRQSHDLLVDSLTNIALFTVYREGTGVLEWVYGEQVERGTHRMHRDIEYVCIQPHVTEFTPDLVPALWEVYVNPNVPVEWEAGVYDIDVLVTHNGRTWKSLMNANGFEPGVVGTWRDQSDVPLWVAPAGSVGLWQVGDNVEHGGHRWQNTSPDNVFEPGVFGWTDLGLYP